MREATRWLALGGLALALLACRGETPEPCTSADLAAGRCLETPGEPERLPEGSVLPDWARLLCQHWRSVDGSCDQRRLIADYGECLKTKGVPAMEALRKQGVANRVVQVTLGRKTNTCLELRGWRITEAGRVQHLLSRREARPAP